MYFIRRALLVFIILLNSLLVFSVDDSLRISKDDSLETVFLTEIEKENQLLQYYTQINDFENAGYICLELADDYSGINNFDKAIEYYSKAIRLFEKAGNRDQVLETVLSIVELHIAYGNMDLAIEYTRQVQKIVYVRPYDDPVKMHSNMLMGISFGYIEQNDSAMKYFEEVLEYTQLTADTIMRAGVYNNIGAIYSKENKLVESFEQYEKALHLFSQLDYERGIALCMSNIAYLKMKQEKYTEAINLFIQTIDVFIRNNDNAYLQNVYANLSDAYAAINDAANELKYFRLYTDLKNDMNANALERTVQIQQIQYKLDQKEKSLQLYEAEMKIIEQQSRIRRLMQFILIAGILIISVLGFLVIRNMRFSLKNTELKNELLQADKKSMTAEIKYKGKELENIALRVVEKNDFLDVLYQEIDKIEGTEDDHQRLREITKKIRENLYISNDINELNKRIDELHSHFLFRLDQKHPDLSKTERKVASYIVMELTNKEIASLMNISIDGVKKSRYRLRKKLKIDSEDSFIDYFQNM
ncbi:MAG: hypothetical protein C0592_00970 [Marinilabiliales bacterium]|nr:MAG: hypothetical protein C0592_00970 [Marinilabiliales bacterium]